MLNFHNKYSYKNFPFSNTIQHWFSVTGSYDMEGIDNKYWILLIKIYKKNK